MTPDAPIHDREAHRAAWDDDEERITRRVHAALNAGTRSAVVNVVLDETSGANDARKAVERALDLAEQWERLDPNGTMSRERAAAILRQVIA